ncbi:MAG: hypothetical protein MUD00_00785 [Candidatus Pacebacteria bacterium]|nr:hypothetical protein [Candidatus Paceibacterota bacterium]
MKHFIILLLTMLLGVSAFAQVKGLAFEKKGEQKELPDVCDGRAKKVNNSNTLNCTQEIMNEAIDVGFALNRPLFLSEPKNSWMTKRDAFGSDQILFIMERSKKVIITFKKGQLNISRVLVNDNGPNTFEFNYFREPRGIREFRGDSIVEALDVATGRMVKIAAQFTEYAFAYQPPGGTVIVPWMLYDCKNPCAVVMTQKRVQYTEENESEDDPQSESIVTQDPLLNAGGPDGATIYRDSLDFRKVASVQQTGGSGDVNVFVDARSYQNVNAGNNNGNGTVASSPQRDSVVVRLEPIPTYRLCTQVDNQGYYAYSPSQPPPQAQQQCYNYYDPRYGTQPQQVYRNRNGIWYFLGGAAVGAGTALLLDHLYGGGRGGNTVIHNTFAPPLLNTPGVISGGPVNPQNGGPVIYGPGYGGPGNPGNRMMRF